MSNHGIEGQEGHGEDEGTRDGCDRILRPQARRTKSVRGTATETTSVLGDQSSLAKYGEENSKVQRCCPEPMLGVETGCLFEVAPEENDREPEEHLNRNISNVA